MSIFNKKKKFKISECDPTFKVRYLGNVQTALMKGEGCADKATAVLWSNFVHSNGTVGLNMSITVCASGMRAVTSEQGLTEYRAHRISYCIAHPIYPRLFVWVYRHEGRKMKVELRCHAALCKNQKKAHAMALSLHEKLTFSLNEFMRDKRRRQNSRLTLQKTNSLTSLPGGNSAYGASSRSKLLNTGQKFKPSIDQSSSAPKLGAITESFDEELAACIAEAEEKENEQPEVMGDNKNTLSDNKEFREQTEENGSPLQGMDRRLKAVDTGQDIAGFAVEDLVVMSPRAHDIDELSSGSQSGCGSDDGNMATEDDLLTSDLANIQEGMCGLEIGNDLEELRRVAAEGFDGDEDSTSESGSSDNRETESDNKGCASRMGDNIKGDNFELIGASIHPANVSTIEGCCEVVRKMECGCNENGAIIIPYDDNSGAILCANLCKCLGENKAQNSSQALNKNITCANFPSCRAITKSNNIIKSSRHGMKSTPNGIRVDSEHVNSTESCQRCTSVHEAHSGLLKNKTDEINTQTEWNALLSNGCLKASQRTITNITGHHNSSKKNGTAVNCSSVKNVASNGSLEVSDDTHL